MTTKFHAEIAIKILSGPETIPHTLSNVHVALAIWYYTLIIISLVTFGSFVITPKCCQYQMETGYMRLIWGIWGSAFL